jgi:hypothetical protein
MRNNNNSNDTNNHKLQQEIIALTSLIQDLQIQLDSATTRLSTISNEVNSSQVEQQSEVPTPRASNTTTHNSSAPISVGEYVVITNKYKGNKGVTGVVTRVSNTWVWLNTNEGKIIQKKRDNVKRIE